MFVVDQMGELEADLGEIVSIVRLFKLLLWDKKSVVEQVLVVIVLVPGIDHSLWGSIPVDWVVKVKLVWLRMAEWSQIFLDFLGSEQ